MKSCVTDYEHWLRTLAEKGGKGAVDNIDARALGRIADEIAWLKAQRKRLRQLVTTYAEMPFPCHDHMSEPDWQDICEIVYEGKAT